MKKQKKEVIIIAGANGSGKTTFAKSYSKKYPFEFVNADEIAKDIDPDNIQKVRLIAGKRFFEKIDALLSEDKNFLIESTLSGKYLLRMITRLKEQGYSLAITYIFLDTPEMCIERIRERVMKGGHFVPDNDVIRRFYRSMSNFWNVYRFKVDEWFLLHNSKGSFSEIAAGNDKNYFVNDKQLLERFVSFSKGGNPWK